MRNILLLLFFISCFVSPQDIMAEERNTTILYLGDSLTEGFGVESHEAYPALIDRKFKNTGRLNIRTINGGYSGSTTASAFSRLKWYSRAKPDIVVIALGANDGLRGLPTETMQKNLEKAIEFALSNDMKVLLCGMQAPPNYGKGYTDEFKRIFLNLSQKYQVTFVPFLLENVAGIFNKNLPDAIHPNPKGHQQIAETVFPFLNQLFSR